MSMLSQPVAEAGMKLVTRQHAVLDDRACTQTPMDLHIEQQQPDRLVDASVS